MKYNDIFYVFDDPVPFKNLLLYPVRMRDYLEFMTFSDCLTIDKNSIPDSKIISMSYLEYIIVGSTIENLWVGKLDKILRLCLKLNEEENKEDVNYLRDEKGKIFIQIKDTIINSTDFDELRALICEQNSVELEDYTIQKEVRDELRRANEFKNRKSNTKMASLEDQILCIVSSTSMTVDDISRMTIRKFIKLLQRVDHKLHYQIYLQASLSGMVTFKDKNIIQHWMSDLTKNKLDDNLIDKESVEKKLGNTK